MKHIRVHRLDNGTLLTEAYCVEEFNSLETHWTNFPNGNPDNGMVKVIEEKIKHRIAELRELKSAVDRELGEMKELYERVKARR